MKKQILVLGLLFFSLVLHAQDIVVKKNGDVIRATILGTDFTSVRYSVNEASPIVSGMKDIKEFVWNGETYIIKTFFNGKKAEDRFVRIVETGVVNLYSMGGLLSTESAPAPSNNRPRFGVGIGTGGMGGIGGSINIGRQREAAPSGPKQVKTTYFIEKPGTGPIQEVNLNNVAGLKTLLLQKIGDDDDLAQRIKEMNQLDGRGLIAFIKAYNEARN